MGFASCYLAQFFYTPSEDNPMKMNTYQHAEINVMLFMYRSGAEIKNY